MNQPDPSQTFLQEAEDLLASIETVALTLSKEPADSDSVHQLFRAFHTIKGSGAMFGFEVVAAFTHHVETALDHVRSGRMPLNPDVLECVLAAKDHLQHLLDPSGRTDSAALTAAGDAIVRRLNDIVARCGAGLPASAPASLVSTVSAPSPALVPAATDGSLWTIFFRPAPAALACGTNLTALLDELRQLGECRIVADATTIPPLEQLVPDRCYVSWTLTLRGAVELNQIKDVFIFVEDGSELTITRGTPSVEAPTPSTAPCRAADPAPAGAPTPAARPSEPDAAVQRVAKDQVIRVASKKLDRLVGLVGELVMNQSRLNQVAARLNEPDLTVPAEQFDRLIDELREEVLGVRMMPIGSTFSRFNRLVHDLSRDLGKQIELVTEGAETELDKTMLDRLGDPLVHLIRNSIDHGIESAEVRRKAGKPEVARILLSATHVGSNVVIKVADDGGGINRDAVRRIATEKGLIAADAVLSDQEIFNLIFLPGFSTAKNVTRLSGRGVGMDVVKREIEALRGTIDIVSTPGAGTTLSLSLPLTLAIVDGLVVGLGAEQYVVPMSAVTENVELTAAERGAFNGRNVLPVRGELIPYLCLRELFGAPGMRPDIEKVVIVQHAGQRIGVVVDRVIGNHQTVIQSLGRYYRDIRTFSGATIMGDGRVSLILDVAGLVKTAERTPTLTH